MQLDGIEFTSKPKLAGRIDTTETIRRINASLTRGWRDYIESEFAEEEIALCGGGASLDDEVSFSELQAIVDRGVKVMALNRTHDWLIERNTVPWAGMLLDPMPFVADYITPRHDVRYYISSQCDPATLDKFEPFDRWLFHAATCEEQFNGVSDHVRHMMLPPWGCTVGLHAIWLALALGFRTLHLFGYDTSYRDGKLYAYEKPHAILSRRKIKVPYAGGERIYESNHTIAPQASMFNQTVLVLDRLTRAGVYPTLKLIVHGDGVVPDIARHYGIHAENQAPHAPPTLHYE
jgi:hypothetical protein